jgi:tRNA-2-methylthio-N6-dimethylallyladenosine synthase
MAETDAVCNQLHLPLQSGSNRILAAMHRGYNVDRFMSRLALARSLMPDLAVSTDVIVGFPGETESDFEATMEVIDAARFDQAFTFMFSPRPGTAAADMRDLYVDADVMQARYQRLLELQNRIVLEKNLEQVGRVEEVLTEGPSKKDPAMATARTEGNRVVHVEGEFPPGRFLQVEITSAHKHHLMGVVR